MACVEGQELRNSTYNHRMTLPHLSGNFKTERSAVKVDLGWACLTLLPSAPYSIRDESSLCVLGLAFERQRGVHAVGGDRRQDFDAWPGDLAITSPNVGIFSESRNGGEYLTLHLTRAASE